MDPSRCPARHEVMPTVEILSPIVAVLFWIALLSTLDEPSL
ncbi:MAG: hypothetical protein ABIW50_08810 [Candidatus Limnocylindria bacterium]